MATETTQRYYAKISKHREENQDIVIPNGEVWTIREWHAAINPTSNTHVCLIWDYEGVGEEIIALAYESQTRFIGRQLTGDGVKKLSIVHFNESPHAEDMGAEFIYKVVG